MDRHTSDKKIRYLIENVKKRRWKRIVAFLACIVVFCTTYALILPAITLERNYYCGLDEHTHTDSCYTTKLICQEIDSTAEDATEFVHVHGDECYEQEPVLICTDIGHSHSEECKGIEKTLNCIVPESEEHIHEDSCYTDTEVYICGLEETEHIHGENCYEIRSKLVCEIEETVQEPETVEEHVHEEACYETVLSCTAAEHVHELACQSDKNADVETAADWEATLPKELTGDRGKDVIAVAESQIGYTESTKNFIVVEGDDEKKGYTRYGDWYGNPYGDWCAMFASFCLNYADIPSSEIPYEAGCQNWINKLTEKDMYAQTGTYTPEPGDLVFFEVSKAGYANHVGIVKEVSEDGGFTTIEGNSSDKVKTVTYDADHNKILGYGILPKNKTEENVEAVELAVEDMWLVSNQESLTEAISVGVPSIRLENDFTVSVSDSTGDDSVSGPIRIPENADITIDLNGHSLKQQGNTSLFLIPEGSILTIIDSGNVNETMKELVEPNETVEEPEGSTENESKTEVDEEIPYEKQFLIGNQAQASESAGKVTLTYYVTKPSAPNSTSGATVETLEEYTVISAGTILTDNQTVFEVTGGTLNLQGGMIYGGTDHAVKQSAGETNLSGGYIGGFVNSENGGAIYSTGGKLTISGDVVLAGNSALRGGAVYADNTEVEMNGGIISGNISTTTESSGEYGTHYGGGGIYFDTDKEAASVFSMKDGYITNNIVNSTGYFDGGGGVLAKGSSKIIIEGGYITGNEASSGGGIRTDWQSPVSFVMTNGYICSNAARTSEGGGISLNIQSTGFIEGGYINNNITNSNSDWGGGGVFCSTGSTLYIRNALVTENHAGGYGGGVAGCSTGRVYICVKEGAAIYENSADGLHMSGDSSTKNEDRVYAYNNEIFTKNGYQDYFCALNSVVEGAMLGNNSANWIGSADGTPVRVGKEDTLMAAYVMGLTANPAADAKADASSAAAVFINGNTAFTHGGGILCNGYMIIGETDNIDLGARIELKATKELLDSDASSLAVEEGQFTFEVIDAQTGALISLASNDENGKINFKERLAFTSSGTFVYYIREVAGDDKEIVYDTTTYRLTVEVAADTSLFDEITVDGEVITIHKTEYLLKTITIEKQNGEEDWIQISRDTDPDNSDSSAIVLELTADATFTNVKQTETSLKVIKKWDDGDSKTRPDSVVVQLFQNGKPYGDKVELNAGMNWTYEWNGLPVADGDITYIYSVEEESVPGYIAEYESINESSKTGTWIPASSLQEGGRYIIVSPDSQNVLYVNDDKVNSNFTASEVKAVVPSEMIINDITYKNAISTDQIEERSVFRAEITTSNSNKRMLLKNMGVNGNSWLLAQGSNGLKGCNSENYSSGVKYENGLTSIQFEWNKDNTWRVLSFVNNQFGSVESNQSNDANKALLYEYVNTSVSANTTIKITNRSVDAAAFELNITKISNSDENMVLPDAQFKLLDSLGENTLYFTMTSSGVYVPAEAEAEGATQTLITNKDGKLVLKELGAGTYILRETKAPSNHALIEDMVIELGKEDENGNITLIRNETIVDPLYIYELPETGGIGTHSYIMGGWLLMVTAGALLLYKNKKRGKEDYRAS